MNIIKYYILLLSFIASPIWSQNPIKSQVDTTEIKIGEAIGFTIKAQVNADDQVDFPSDPLFGPFEVIDHQPIDTILRERQMELIKKYTLTQFDSGKYTLPRLSVLVNGKNYQTDFFDITVHNVQVDSLKQPMYDIKDTYGGTTNTSKIFGYVLAICLCVIAGVIAYFIIRKIQNKNLTEDDLYRTPLEKVTKKLQLLDAKRLVINGDVKAYYSEMTDVIRDYIEEVFDIPAKESTTTEVIQLLLQTIKKKKIKLNKETINALKRVLETADLVKFAKSEPSIHQIENDRKVMDTVSVTFQEVVPKFAEEQSKRVRLREQRYKKRKQLRTWIPIGVSTLGVLIVGAFYIVQLVKEGTNISLFETNKTLYNQEWVTSSYGFPAIVISTPNVLERIEESSENKQGKPESASFLYQNINTNFLLFVSTSNSNTAEVNLEQIVDYKLQFMQQKFLFTNIQSQQEKFVQQGVDGIRNYGTYQAVIDNKTIEMEYEMFVFSQASGLQDLWISYPKDDEFGKKIAQRVIESIQLNVTKSHE